jgi:hypothetical protein
MSCTALGIDAEPRSRLVPEEAPQVASEDLVCDVEEPVGGMERERALVPLGQAHARRFERGHELRPFFVRESELLLDRPLHEAERVLGAVVELQLHLAEGGRWRVDVIHGQESDHRIPAHPPEALAVVRHAGADLEPLEHA